MLERRQPPRTPLVPPLPTRPEIENHDEPSRAHEIPPSSFASATSSASRFSRPAVVATPATPPPSRPLVSQDDASPKSNGPLPQLAPPKNKGRVITHLLTSTHRYHRTTDRDERTRYNATRHQSSCRTGPWPRKMSTASLRILSPR